MNSSEQILIVKCFLTLYMETIYNNILNIRNLLSLELYDTLESSGSVNYLDSQNIDYI